MTFRVIYVRINASHFLSLEMIQMMPYAGSYAAASARGVVLKRRHFASYGEDAS